MRSLMLCRPAAFVLVAGIRWLLRVSVLGALALGATSAATLQGVSAGAGGSSPADPVPAPNPPALRYFAGTGHILPDGFHESWEGRQGATLPGLQLTEEFTEPQVELNPPSVAEGYTMQIRVGIPQGGKATGTLDDTALTFVRAGATEMRAVAGAAAMGAVGAHKLTLTITDAQGRSRTVTRTVQVTPWAYPVDRLTLDDATAELLDPDIVNGELNQLAKIYAGRSGGPLWSGTFRAPLAGTLTVNAPFGERRAYNGGPVSTFHAGVDLRAAQGTPVLASAAGRVVLATRLQVRGNAIIIDHGMGVFTLSAHLSAFKVNKGDTVRAGQVIGLSGNTGLSTGPHLHWEMHVSGPAVNPFEWTRRAFP